MTTDLLIHATLTVRGDRELLTAADACIKTLLVEEIFEGGFEEHHGDDALCYDFKVRGGVPFPAFALASQEFPRLEVLAEWVNVAAGRRGHARIADGKIVEHVEDMLAAGAADAANRYFDIAGDGTLRLAFAVMRRSHTTWAGYVLNHERDALFRITCDGDAIELMVTEGAPEWASIWSMRGEADRPVSRPCEPPEPVERELYAELERMAQDFVGEWIWLRDAPVEETAIDRDRYGRYGYPVRDANVRVARLQRIRGDAAIGDPVEYSTLESGNDWIRPVLKTCWA